MSTSIASYSDRNEPEPDATGRGWPTKTGKQMRVLLDVLLETRSFLQQGENFRVRDTPEEEARVAAARTYESASLQIRNLLDEQSRWAPVDPADRLEDKIEEIDAAIAQVRLRSLQELQRPCVVLQAKVRFLPQHARWVAYVGELGEGCLHGAGATPADALANFDTVYANGFPAQTPKKKPHGKRTV